MKGFQLFFLLIITSICFSQTKELNGTVKATDDLFGVHVINSKSQSYATTNVKGEFKIKGQLNDTIIFSSILYKLKKVVLNKDMLRSQYFSVFLEPYLNELDEVTLGRVLTGNLDSDIKNSGNEKQLTFEDLGIPGYTGKPLTQNQNRLQEASKFSGSVGGGIGGGGVGLSINPLINAITGRTKMLKERVEIEEKTDVLRRIKHKFSKSFFDENPLPEDKREEFFLFCKDQPDFLQKCTSNDLEAFQFLQTQYKVYLQRL